ncbi:hypothetical protein [Actinoplanes sp. NPDC026670]|uniref:hypothetical protein n=1 Tax=Actinoplanes sp. NPDC026670 TaxID=3154700 RepID=UPI0033D3D1B0
MRPLALGLAVAAAGVAIAATSARPLLVGTLFLAGLLVGGGLIALATKRLIADGRVPNELAGVSTLLAVGSLVLLWVMKDNSPAHGLMTGEAAGLLLGVSLAIRAVRRSLR